MNLRVNPGLQVYLDGSLRDFEGRSNTWMQNILVPTIVSDMKSKCVVKYYVQVLNLIPSLFDQGAETHAFLCSSVTARYGQLFTN